MSLVATLVSEFATLEPYPAATVYVYKAGTTDLASLFLDPAMTEPADNPQTLTSETVGAYQLGRFAAPIYTPGSYQIEVNGNRLGIVRPTLNTLEGEDASYALARTRRFNFQRRLIDRFADTIRVQDFGLWTTGTDSSATNAATLVLAIGAAAELGGAVVRIPAGTYEITTVDLPAGVRLQGEGTSATILRSTEGEAVVTFSGQLAGLTDITIDGVSLVSGSIGLYGESADDIRLDNVVVKRFEKGIEFKGGRDNEWWEVHIENCEEGARLLGDVNAGDGSTGDKWELNRWNGGSVIQCTTRGVFLSYEDRAVEHNALYGVDFKDNTGNAVEIQGARDTKLEDCYFETNTVDIKIYDDGDTALDDNKTVGFFARNSKIEGGEIQVDGLAQDVVFERVDFVDVDFELSLPQNAIHLRSCYEDAQVTIAGDGTKLVRSSDLDVQEINGVTTDATALSAFSVPLDHGQVAYIEAKIHGNQRNGINKALYHISMGFKRPAATLAYDAQTANFTAGLVVTGSTSGATARIVADVDGGASGTLSLRDVSGIFRDNELITDTGGGSATVNGTLVSYDAQLTVSASLPYDAQTSNFTAGQVVTGGTSGAKAYIVSDADGGATGTLTIRDITAAFLDNEAITDPLGGAAVVNIATTGLTLTSLSQVLRTAYETDTDWDAYFRVNGAYAEIMVKGKSSQTIEWTVRADLFLD